MNNFLNFPFFLVIGSTSFFFYLFIRNSAYLEKISSKYDTIQKIHSNYVPPFGGIIIFTHFYIYIYLFYPNSILIEPYFFFPSLIIILTGLKEDIFLNVSAKIRFLIIFFVSIIFIYNCESLPVIEIDIINNIFKSFPLIEILFYSIGLTALANGLNMIDGMNGLAGFSALSIITALLSLLFLTDQFALFFGNQLIILFFLIVIFLIFNFPFGKIFLGDAGAYWLGWILGALIIYIFTYSELNTWSAVLIIFYPIFEVIFSTFRKLFQKKTPLEPDIEHLHLKLYFVLKGPTKRSKEFNSFTTLCLMPLWFSPCLLVIWSYYFSHLAIVGIVFLLALYLIFYNFLKKKVR